LSAKPFDLPKIRRRAHGGILGSSAQQGCSANPWRSNVHRGCFPPAAESRLYVRALVFAGCSAGAPTQL